MKKITFYKQIYKRHRLKKNVPNCSSKSRDVGDLLRVNNLRSNIQCTIRTRSSKNRQAEKDRMKDDTPVDDFCARALSSLTQRIALANDDSGVVASNTPTTDDVDELESHAKSLVEDDVPKIDRAVRSYLALVAARSSVASDVDVLSASHSTTATTTLLAASGAASVRSTSRASSAADINRRSLVCARALLSAIDSTILPPLDDGVVDDGDDSRAKEKMQSSQKNAATRILWNGLVVRSSSKSISESLIFNGSGSDSDETTKRRASKPSKVLGRRSLIVAYPYIQERLRRGHGRGGRTDVDIQVDGDVTNFGATASPSSSSATDRSLRSERRRAIRSLSDEALPPAIPPVGIDLDQWESFFSEFGRLLTREVEGDGRDDKGGRSSRREECRSMDGERRHHNDDGALLWSKDGGLAELRSRREDRARRASSGASASFGG